MFEQDNGPVKIPIIIPEADFTHPEDEHIHSMHSAGGASLFLFGMIIHSCRSEKPPLFKGWSQRYFMLSAEYTVSGVTIQYGSQS